MLQVAPSSYYAAKQRRPCARHLRDQALKQTIARVHAANYGVYGPARCGASYLVTARRWLAAPWND
jgi:putative transposase